MNRRNFVLSSAAAAQVALAQSANDQVPTAILSRATAGTRAGALIINLPGNPRAIGECLPMLIPAIRECLRHLSGQ